MSQTIKIEISRHVLQHLHTLKQAKKKLGDQTLSYEQHQRIMNDADTARRIIASYVQDGVDNALETATG